MERLNWMQGDLSGSNLQLPISDLQSRYLVFVYEIGTITSFRESKKIDSAARFASRDGRWVQLMSFLRRLDKSGTSLIEVLVTFVVFLVGMVSVLRMFPGGFLSMRHTENATLAHRLAQTEIERWEGKTANLPSGILAWGEVAGSPGVNVVLTDVDPANLEDPLLPGGYYFSDANKYRRINSESTRIPVPTAANWNMGSVYVLGFSPIAWSNTTPNPDPIVIYGGEMRRKPFPRNVQNLQLKRYSEYALDYEHALLYLRPFRNRTRSFIITYSYWLESGTEMLLYPAVGVSVLVPPPSSSELDDGYQIAGIPVPGGVPPGNWGIDQGSDSLHREFDEIAAADVWNMEDPYEFKVLDPVGGVIAFNPLGYGYEELTARGKEPLTAYIDYTVLDWHIIHEERRLPDTFNSAADQDVKLTLRFIKKAGETMEPDGSTYQGLASEPPYSVTGSPLIPYDVLAVDVETGDVYTQQSVTATGNPVFTVNYKEGIIRFDPSYVILSPAPRPGEPGSSPFQGKTFRIYYRAEGDWALQAFKAYDVYRRSYTPSLDHRQYYFYPSDGRIYFPRCYAGCTVAVDYSYRLDPNDPDRFITGEAYQISDDTALLPGAPAAYCYIDILQKLHEVNPGIDIDPNTFMRRIAKVYGVSVGTRVIWHETGKRLRAGSWRKVDLQTYLTRVSG